MSQKTVQIMYNHTTMCICLEKSASVQPRTSPPRSCSHILFSPRIFLLTKNTTHPGHRWMARPRLGATQRAATNATRRGDWPFFKMRSVTWSQCFLKISQHMSTIEYNCETQYRLLLATRLWKRASSLSSRPFLFSFLCCALTDKACRCVQPEKSARL